MGWTWNERLGGYIGNLGTTEGNRMAQKTSETLNINTGAGDVLKVGVMWIIGGAFAYLLLLITFRR